MKPHKKLILAIRENIATSLKLAFSQCEPDLNIPRYNVQSFPSRMIKTIITQGKVKHKQSEKGKANSRRKFRRNEKGDILSGHSSFLYHFFCTKYWFSRKQIRLVCIFVNGKSTLKTICHKPFIFN